MKNIWLDIDLSDYENHMSLPSIGQAQYLASWISSKVEFFNPESMAILGCAGGNGLDKINSTALKKIICVDINPSFLETARKRYSNSFKDIEFICCDISSGKCFFGPVELVFAGLVFEYVNYEITIKNISKCIKQNGILAAVLQLPNKNISEVSPGPYKSLEKLSEKFAFVPADKLIVLCEINGIKLLSQSKVKLESGKEFQELILRRDS